MKRVVSFPKEFASSDSLQRALYRLADRCTWDISSNEFNWEVALTPLAQQKIDELETEFRKTVVDYGLREKIRNETEQVRGLLFAHAFSKVDQ